MVAVGRSNLTGSGTRSGTGKKNLEEKKIGTPPPPEVAPPEVTPEKKVWNPPPEVPLEIFLRKQTNWWNPPPRPHWKKKNWKLNYWEPPTGSDSRKKIWDPQPDQWDIWWQNSELQGPPPVDRQSENITFVILRMAGGKNHISITTSGYVSIAIHLSQKLANQMQLGKFNFCYCF